jgi:hypothetical protein
MKLMLDGDLKGFPPRLPEQPIFYPVLNKPYADQIARSWNTKDKFSGYVGFVTEFKVESPFIDQFEEQVVGSGMHNELWIPAEQMDEFNQNLVGRIKLVDVFYGDAYKGFDHEGTCFSRRSLVEQFLLWREALTDNPLESRHLMQEYWQMIFVNASFWSKTDLASYNISEQEKADTLAIMKQCWRQLFPDMELFFGS